MSGGSYGRQAADYHKNSHPRGDLIPMHMCGEPSCLEATGREPQQNMSGRFPPHCPADWGSGTMSQQCTRPPGHAGSHEDLERREWEHSGDTQAHVMQNVSGRDQPRQTEDVTHDVRFWGNLHAQGDLFAECDACHWSAGLLGGHTAPQLMDLVRQHAGITS